jgi:sirohydrochlorin ferrochelatase
VTQVSHFSLDTRESPTPDTEPFSIAMDSLILFSHGSLLCGAGETLQEHARKLRERGAYAAVEVGFMNYSEPTFEEAVERCVRSRCDRIVVVPYFLIPGKFVKIDLPRRVAAAGEAHPGVRFVVSEALGYDTLLADSLLDLAEHARGPERWRDDYDRASHFCEADPDCPLYGTPRCPRVPEAIVSAVPA